MKQFKVYNTLSMNLSNVFIGLTENHKLGLAILIIVFLFCMVVFAIIYGVLLRKKNLMTEKKRLENSNIFCNCILNLRTQTVKIIKLNNLDDIQTIPFLDFLTNFSVKEQNDLKLWFESLVVEKDPCENKKVFLATEVIYSTNKKNIKYEKTTLTVNQIDRAANVIYFIKEPQKYIPCQIKNKKLIKNKRNNEIFLNYSQIKSLFESNELKKGSCYFIKLISKNDTFCSFNEKYIFYKIMNNFFKYYEESNIYVLFNEENPLDILIFDSKGYTEYQLSNRVSNIYNKIQRMCDVDGFSRFFSIVAISTKCEDLSHEFDKSYGLINKYCSSMIEEKKCVEYLNAKSNDFKALQDTYSNEVSYIINNGLVNIYFDPVIKITPKRVTIFGYNYTPILSGDSKFVDFEEFKKYANKFDYRKECYSFVIRKTISNFINQKNNASYRLFSLIDLQDVPYANRLFPHISDLKDCNLILTFKNNEFIDNENDEEYIHVIKNAQTKGYDCALYRNINDYDLKESTYKLFNYFLFNLENYKELKSNSREFVKVHCLLEKFVKFNKPIICVNVYNWAVMELLIKCGITYFSSPNVFSSSTLLSPLDKKTLRKFNSIVKE